MRRFPVPTQKAREGFVESPQTVASALVDLEKAVGLPMARILEAAQDTLGLAEQIGSDESSAASLGN